MEESKQWNETEETTVKDIDQAWITGFWRRFFAFCIDSIFLGLIGYSLGLIFADQFIEMGALGKLVGFSVALTYFGLMNSSLFNGQTLGKLALNIRVVTSKGKCISVPKSFARYTVYGIPFFLNGTHFTSNTDFIFLSYLLSMAVFGGMLSILYLYVFNRRTRQSLHDLIVGSYVVNADASVNLEQPIWKGHLFVTALLLVTTTALPALPIIPDNFGTSSSLNQILSVQKALETYPNIEKVGVRSGTTTISHTGSEPLSTNYISVSAFVPRQKVNDSEFAKEIATLVVKETSDISSVDVVQIHFIHGFDIGIWSQWSQHNHNFKPEELTQLL